MFTYEDGMTENVMKNIIKPYFSSNKLDLKDYLNSFSNAIELTNILFQYSDDKYDHAIVCVSFVVAALYCYINNIDIDDMDWTNFNAYLDDGIKYVDNAKLKQYYKSLLSFIATSQQ